MSLFELFVLAVGLSMDAFAVSVCKGLAMKQITFKNAGNCWSMVRWISGAYASYRVAAWKPVQVIYHSY